MGGSQRRIEGSLTTTVPNRSPAFLEDLKGELKGSLAQCMRSTSTSEDLKGELKANIITNSTADEVHRFRGSQRRIEAGEVGEMQ